MTGAASLAPVVGNIGVANEIFAASADGAGTNLLISKFLADRFFGFESAFAEQVGGIVKLDAFVINKQMCPAVATVVQHHAIPAGAFQGD